MSVLPSWCTAPNLLRLVRQMTPRFAVAALSGLAVALMTGATPAHAQAVDVFLGDSARTRVVPGTRLTVPVTVDLTARGALTVASLQGSLRWTVPALRLDSIRAAAPGWSVTANLDSVTAGRITLVLYSPTALAASGAVAQAYFTAGTAPQGARVDLALTAAGDEAGTSILGAVRPRGLVACVAPAGVWGDVNDDAQVNVLDAQQIARHSVGLAVGNAAALADRGDVTADGAINVLDAQQVARHSVALSAAARINTARYAPPAVASVAVVPAGAVTLAVGARRWLGLSARAADGTELAGCVPETWASSAAGVATVSTGGLVTGVGAGTATVTGSSGSASTPVAVTVSPAPGLGIGFAADQFVRIEPGSFEMGNAGGWPDNRPVRPVTITRAFMLQRSEVTQGQWQAVMGSNPSNFSSCGSTCPVENVSWEQVQAFLSALNTQDPGKGYRLPTEAEWEYAARAGTTGDIGGNAVLNDMGWWSGNSTSRTWPVGQKRVNAWGLFDMHGNVWEWLSDWYANSYTGATTVDPTGPSTGTTRVIRGGAWNGSAEDAITWSRGDALPNASNSSFGLRLVRNP
jgi:formylglycine-generating enzyme required for sulfatase activity